MINRKNIGNKTLIDSRTNVIFPFSHDPIKPYTICLGEEIGIKKNLQDISNNKVRLISLFLSLITYARVHMETESLRENNWRLLRWLMY